VTPAINLAKKRGIAHAIHQYQHDPQHASYGEEAAEKLAVDPRRVFKTLVVESDKEQLAVALVPVCYQLDLKACASAFGFKRVQLAPQAKAQQATGYLVGGISPLAQKRRLPMRIDTSADTFATIFVSAGRRGLEIELAAADLLQLCAAQFATIGRPE